MEDRPHSTLFRDWIRRGFLIWVIIALAAVTRFYHSFHFFLSDEAYNLITIETLASQKDFHPYFLKHPPLYILLSAFFFYLIGPYPQIPSYLSIFFSVISIIPFYLIAEYLMGRKTALWAALFLSAMPSNIFYSTWIKQDAMLLFFFLWGIYFYLGERYKLAGLAIGIALLIKEFALFFFPLSLLITVISRGKGAWIGTWRGWVIMILISSGISLWWYILFGKMFFLSAGEALTGAYVIEWYWYFPWWFFLKNLPHDLSYPIFALFLAGLILIINEVYKRGPRPDCLIPLAWLAAIYVPISFFYIKSPWFIYLATPALAIIAAFGLVKGTSFIQSRGANLAIYFLTLITIALLLPAFDHLQYNFKLTGAETRRIPLKIIGEIHGKSWDDMIRNKRSWEEKMRNINGKVGFLEYHPVLQYMTGLEDERVARLRVSRFIGLDREGLLKFVNEENIGGLVLFSESLAYTGKNMEDMISLWGMPEKAGPLLIFRTGYKFKQG